MQIRKITQESSPWKGRSGKRPASSDVPRSVSAHPNHRKITDDQIHIAHSFQTMSDGVPLLCACGAMAHSDCRALCLQGSHHHPRRYYHRFHLGVPAWGAYGHARVGRALLRCSGARHAHPNRTQKTELRIFMTVGVFTVGRWSRRTLSTLRSLLAPSRPSLLPSAPPASLTP